MAPAATRQDVQNLLDQTKNRITERMATRQDMQCLQDLVRGLIVTNQQMQQMMRQSEAQNALLMRRTIALEGRIGQFEQELRTLQQFVSRLIDRKPEQIVLPASPEENKRYGQYIYRPT